MKRFRKSSNFFSYHLNTFNFIIPPQNKYTHLETECHQKETFMHSKTYIIYPWMFIICFTYNIAMHMFTYKHTNTHTHPHILAIHVFLQAGLEKAWRIYCDNWQMSLLTQLPGGLDNITSFINLGKCVYII